MGKAAPAGGQDENFLPLVKLVFFPVIMQWITKLYHHLSVIRLVIFGHSGHTTGEQLTPASGLS